MCFCWTHDHNTPAFQRAFCTVGRYHDIGVEDDVTIYGEYENGSTAVFISTTGEAPGTNRLEISGDLGKIVIECGKLKWWRLKVPEREFCLTSKEGFVSPETEYEEFSAPESEGHPKVIEAFAQSILNGTEMIADGAEGLNSLSISNAAYLSSWTDDWAEIPTDEALFEKYLIDLCRKEKYQSKPEQGESTENISERWRVRW